MRRPQGFPCPTQQLGPLPAQRVGVYRSQRIEQPFGSLRVCEYSRIGKTLRDDIENPLSLRRRFCSLGQTSQYFGCILGTRCAQHRVEPAQPLSGGAGVFAVLQ